MNRASETLLVAALVGACSLTSCRRDDTAPAVAAVSVAAARARVAIGAPLELTYRFELLPGATLPLDHKVFVHLVDATGRMVWNDDHDPPVPTSQWKAGQPVQYTRTRFLPTTGLAPGEMSVLVGLYRDERVPLETAGSAGRDRAYPVASIQLAPESENVFLIYTNGWHGQEHADDASRSWSWTEQVSSISFTNPKADLTLYLEYDARPDAFGGKPQRVTVTAGGQPVGEFAATQSVPTLERISVPAAVLGSSEMAELKIEVDPVFVPASLAAGGRDERRLGIRVYHAFLERR